MSKLMFCLFLIFFCNLRVEALKFQTGSYIPGEYITRVSDGTYYYLTGRYIEDSNGNILYCLEPFVSFESEADYVELDSYSKLNSDVLEKIELLSYYGYGYTNRTDSKWYVITQFLIWRTVSNKEIYFTDKLNGNKIVKYEKEMQEILDDVNNHNISNLIKNYTVNYSDDLNINLNGYSIISSDFKIENGKIKNIEKSGKILVSKKSNFYSVNTAYFEGGYSQDLIMRGNVENDVEEININVLKSNIMLDINVDNKALDFNVCYDILKDGKKIDGVCSNDNLDYKSIDLSYGNYKIIQSNLSLGYVRDEKIYDVNLQKDVEIIVLNNKIIKNNLEILKYYCFLDNCSNEAGAIFEVYNSNNSLVGSLVTNAEGYGKLELLYGKYIIKQISGKEGYSYVSDFEVNIDSLSTKYKFYLINKKIIESEDENLEKKNEDEENNNEDAEDENVTKDEDEVEEENAEINKDEVGEIEDINKDEPKEGSDINEKEDIIEENYLKQESIENVELKDDVIKSEDFFLKENEIIPPKTGVNIELSYIILSMFIFIECFKKYLLVK